MKTTITEYINTGIVRMAMLYLLFGLYTNFALSQETVTDVDGNIYQTVIINGKVWTLSNYRVTKYADGTSIPSGLNNADWGANTDGAYAASPTGDGDAATYGLLYNGYAVRNTTHGGIAVPAGWRIATDEDWQALEAYLGMATGDLALSAWRGASASVGQKLKSTTTDWTSHANVGTDAVGFKALPAGTRGTNGTFTNASQQAAFWTPIEGVESDPNYTNRRALNYNRVDIHRTDIDKRNGLSVRLVKITTTPVELINYNLKQNFNSVTLSWETVSEQDNDYFVVERSVDGVNFSEIAKLAGKGTINQRQTYSLTDYFPVNGTNYYRLKQYDKNGTANNYGVKAANFQLDNTVSATVVPNPVTGTSVKLILTGYQGKKLSANLIRLDGAVVEKWDSIIADDHSKSGYILSLKNKPVAGQYILHVQGNGFSQPAKLIVQ